MAFSDFSILFCVFLLYIVASLLSLIKILVVLLQGGQIISSPAVDVAGNVYIGSKDFFIYSISSSGKLNWKYQTSGAIVASPTIGADGTLYVGSDIYLFAISATGALKWKFLIAASVAPSITYSSAVVGPDGNIYFGGVDKCFYSISPSGTFCWRYCECKILPFFSIRFRAYLLPSARFRSITTVLIVASTECRWYCVCG